jgi:hypothetical protein
MTVLHGSATGLNPIQARLHYTSAVTHTYLHELVVLVRRCTRPRAAWGCYTAIDGPHVVCGLVEGVVAVDERQHPEGPLPAIVSYVYFAHLVPGLSIGPWGVFAASSVFVDRVVLGVADHRPEVRRKAGGREPGGGQIPEVRSPQVSVRHSTVVFWGASGALKR